MPRQIVEAVRIVGSDVEFANRISQTVPRIIRAVRITSVRRLSHPYADVTNGHRSLRELQRDRAALAVRNNGRRKRYPRALGRLMDGLFPGPVLHPVLFRVRVGP